MNKTAAISERIMAELEKTGCLKTAFDTVMGAGAYDHLAGEVYDGLRAKAAS
jgi:hypothetical protein